MDVRRLEVFRKVYELRSFSGAGEDLYLSQPTISSHVATLEKELGIPLFDRIGRNVLPTDAAEVLYHHAVDIFDRLERARAAVDLLSNKVAGELTVGGSSIPSNYLLPSVFAGFAARFPAVMLRMAVGDSLDILDRVESGALLMAVVGTAPESSELTSVELAKDELVLVGGARFEQRLLQLSDPEDLADLPWVIRESGSGTRRACERAFKNAGIDAHDLHVAAEVESTEGIIRCVAAGLGVGVVSRMAVDGRFGAEDDVVSVPFMLPVKRSFHLVYHASRFLLPAPAAFVNYVSGVFQSNPGSAEAVS